METTHPAELPVASASRGSLRGAYLQRLHRLLRLRQQHEQELNTQGLRLLDRSIFTAYCDCRDVGAEEDARRALRDAEFVVRQAPMPFGPDPDRGEAA